MMVAVLALGIPAGPGAPAERLIRQVPLLHQAIEADPEQTVSLAGDLAALAEAGQAVLATYPAARRDEALRRVRLLRRMLPGLGLAAVPLGLPPLASAMLIDATRAVTAQQGLDAGQAAAALGSLARHLTVVAWTRSAGSLPAQTGLVATRSQVLRSGLSRRGFEVRVQPPGPGYRAWGDQTVLLPQIRRLRPGSSPDALIGYVTENPVAVLRGAEKDLAWLRLTVEACGLRAVPSPADPDATRRWFGSTRAAELVLLSADLPTLTRDLDVSTRPCSWCGTATPASYLFCLFCDHHERPVPAVQPVGVAR